MGKYQVIQTDSLSEKGGRVVRLEGVKGVSNLLSAGEINIVKN
ncbi:MAG: hypothetical protein WD059_05400 [Balneolaceae bacterium]